MVNTRSFLSLVLAAGLATTLAACNGSSDKAATPPSTSTSSTPPPSSTPAPTTPSVTQSTPVAAATRTKAELTKALLALPELPTGFSIDPDAAGPDDSKLSSKDARCKDLVLLFNADTPPGSKAMAYQSFTGGQDGPYFDEELDAMASPAAATALLNRTKAAVKSCKKATLTVTDVGSSTVTVSEISVPKTGTSPVGGRFTATSGKMAGIEIFFAFTGVGDVVIAMSFDSGDQVEGGLDAAVTKASKSLGTAKTGT